MTVYLDENLSPRIATILRARGIDAVSAHEVGNTRLDDRSQLRYATGDGRAIVTGDIQDYLALAAETIATNASHAGIILVPSRIRTDDFSRIAQRVAGIARLHPEGLAGVVTYLI